MKLQWKVALIILSFGAVTLLVANVLLYNFFKTKDLAAIHQDARNTASLIQATLLNTMIRTGDYEDIESLIKDLQKEENFEFRMVRSEHVIKQHGLKRDEVAKDELEKQALKTGEITEHMDGPDKMRIIYPFVTDNRCGECHVGMDGKPIPSGVVNGVAVIRFDLAEKHRETNAIVLKLMAMLTLLALLFFTGFSYTIYRSVTEPVKNIACAITGLQNEVYDVDLPEYDTQEISIMAGEVRKTAEKLAHKKREREAQFEQELAQAKEIEDFIKSRTSMLGLGKEGGVNEVMGRLSHVVDEAQKGDHLLKALGYIDCEKSRFIIPSDPAVVPAISYYIASLVEEAKIENVKRASIELALDEALSNAIYHGNLEVPSAIKSNDFDDFYELAKQRSKEEQYSSRTVTVDFYFDKKGLNVTMTDEGKGFDWSALMDLKGPDLDQCHGRGLVIIRAVASDVTFNSKGNQVSLVFDFASLAVEA